MTLTTETLNDFIAGQGFGVAPSAVEAMARELLATREAVPVERVTADDMQRVCMEAARHIGKYTVMASEVNKLLRRRPVTAPPAPAVPDEIETNSRAKAIVRELFGDEPVDPAEIAAGVWNACRAAMLAQPVSSGYKLVPVECLTTASQLIDLCRTYTILCDGGNYKERTINECENTMKVIDSLLEAAHEGRHEKDV